MMRGLILNTALAAAFLAGPDRGGSIRGSGLAVDGLATTASYPTPGGTTSITTTSKA